ncbi:type VII secretion protein EsaA [Enterococcus sp. BWB1-3]|uniref:type VII secretion protein EsaA n=1 Tax=Enterococcus sp. BWB1-3 TaxID=2787713 RepID=UPI001F015543|nr:type VII secretion protein EsaA [Enterococcus sp. BWB1-3]MBL1230566.1 type VII secretion protein EsaA [Enterococcus sp. BWB1-3]
MMNRKKLIYILKAVWILLVLLILLLFINKKFSTVSSNNEKETVRLNIALVNEDQGVTSNHKLYQLGSDYVKKVEKETTHDWYTVARGTGENGLKNGSYHLLIIIPSNFSEKLLDLDNPSPEKLRLNYKVNGDGNSTFENESKRIGQQIVNELSKQLVDMYVVSIIDNLYTAQKNIEKVYGSEQDLEEGFKKNMYLPAAHLKESFPQISTQIEETQQANQMVKDHFTHLKETVVFSEDNFSGFETELEKLLAMRSEGKLTYEDLVQSLISLDNTLLSQETTELFSAINKSSNFFSDLFFSAKEDQYFYQAKALSFNLSESRQLIQDQIEQLIRLRTDFFNQNKKQFYRIFGYDEAEQMENGQKITLGDVITKKRKIDSGSESIETDSFLNQAVKVNRRQIEKLQERLNSLPIRNTADHSEFLKIFRSNDRLYGKSEEQAKCLLDEIDSFLTAIQEQVNHINLRIDEYNKGEGISAVESTGIELPLLDWSTNNSTVLKEPDSYYKNFESAYYLLAEEKEKLCSRTASFNIHWENNKRRALLQLTVPECVDFKSLSMNGEGSTLVYVSGDRYIYEVDEFSDKRIYTITYRLKGEGENLAVTNNFLISVSQMTEEMNEKELGVSPSPDEEADTDSPTLKAAKPTEQESGKEIIVPNPNIDQIDRILEWALPVDVSLFLTEDFQKIANAYSEQAGKIKELYEQVVDELTAFETESFLNEQSYLNMDLTVFFNIVIDELFASNGGDFDKQNQNLHELLRIADSMAEKSSDLQIMLEEIQKNTENLNTMVGRQLQKLSDWQKMTQTAMGEKGPADVVNEQTNSSIPAIDDSFMKLLTKSEEVREASQKIIQETSEIEGAFDLFNREIQEAQKNSMNLSANAEKFKQEMSGAFAGNRDFFEEFTDVLNNVYQEGMPNNTLLEFISDPVFGNLETAVQTSLTNQSFAWVLIMFTVSLFLSFVFVFQPPVQRLKVFYSKQKWIGQNIVDTLLLCVSCLILGIILTALSISELQIPKDFQFIWGVVLLIFLTLFTLINHYLLKQLHLAGFAVSLFIFVSYIFSVSSFGNEAGSNWMLDVLQRISPLENGQAVLNDVLSEKLLDSAKLFIYGVVLLELVLFNIFIWKPQKNLKEEIG